MEKLEKTLERVPVVLNNQSGKVVTEKRVYEGLVLVEDRAYQGPTSIRYWM